MHVAPEDLVSYSSPYENWREEFARYLAEVEDYDDSPEEFSTLLFTNVLPYVRHHDSIYDSVVPVFKVFAAMLSQRADYAEEMMYFLGYVFRDYIRDTANILVEPYSYRYLSPRIDQIALDEAGLFEQFKTFYLANKKGNVSSKCEIYFDAVLLKRSPATLALRDNKPARCDDGHGMTCLLAEIVALRNRWDHSLDADELARAFSSLDSRLWPMPLFEHLQSAIDEDAYVQTPWASGRTGAILSTSLLVLSSDEPHRRSMLETILNRCLELKSERNGDEIDLAYVDRFILEDISSILFEEHLGSRRPLDARLLDRTQRLFLDFLNSAYKGHTYTLLYAGVLPEGVLATEIDSVSDIYSID